MKKGDIHPMPAFFDRYINLVVQDDLNEAFVAARKSIGSINLHELEALENKTYAPGKWTVKDILQHLIDNERIQSYRAMRIARHDTTALPGYDENLLAQHAHASRRTIVHLVQELEAVRTSTEIMFQSFSSDNLLQIGTCFNQQISPLALAFVIIGHQQHHLHVIQNKYLPLLSLDK